jgi:trimethylamine--corrinoid protein Co-methyltransferase
MKFTGNALSEAEIESVHQSSLRILNEVGIRYHGEKALPLLEKHGAKVNWEHKTARIPSELVEQALETAPKSFILSARDPRFDYPMPSPASRYCIDGTAAFAIDFSSGERRYGTSQDIRDGLRVFQQMDLGVMAWAPTAANDKPSGSRALHEFFTMMQFCSKHGEHELHTTAQTPYLMEGLIAVAGSEQAARQRKCYSLIYCPVAPLTHDGPMLDAYLELGELEMPVMMMPMPVCGTTGPASLFSNICVSVAENLSALVVYQLAHPGRALIFSSATGILDFSSGGYLGGVPEMGLMSAAMTQMGKFYGLPGSAAGCTADARQPGAQAMLEKLVTTLPPVLAGSDIIIGTGEMESDQVLVLEQLVVDNELGHQIQRLAQGVDTSPEKDLIEDIFQVGPGGHFLKARSTRLAARSGEFYMSRLIPHGSYTSWLGAGCPDLYTNARQKVAEILAGPVDDPLPGEVEDKLAEILRRADAELE